MLSSLKKKILSNEATWCRILKLHNPYADNWNTLISKKVPDFDIQAFNKFKKYNFVYDKLWIAKSQNIKSGTLDEISDIEYPVFIKPRWGHKTSSSKNCFKILNETHLLKYLNMKDMMWSEYINEKEQMTDFFLQQGHIVYQMTCEYSENQNGSIADEWKYISELNSPPTKIVDWVSKHMTGFSGICNVQYRGDKIIEVGLRLARGGAYVYCTNNDILIKNLNSLVETGSWNYLSQKHLSYKPFYSFKCYTSLPIVYLYPQYFMDTIMKLGNCMNFYEYYFEPSGGIGMVSYQFMHHDFEKGKKIKKLIEFLLNIAQMFFYFMILLLIIVYLFYKKYFYIFLFFSVILFSTKILNPLSIHNNLFKAQSQYFKS